MEKTFPMIFIAIMWFAGFCGISQAQNDFSAEEIDGGDKISEVEKPEKLDEINRVEQNVSNMLKLLEELEKGEGLSEKLKANDKDKNKLGEAGPLNHFIKPDEKVNLTHVPNEKNNTKNSIEKADEVVKFVPDDSDSHFRMGLDYWRSKNLDEAIKQFEEVVRLNPENAHGYWNLGLLHEEKNDVSRAIDYMKKAEAIYLKYEYSLYAEEARKHLENLSRKKNSPSKSTRLTN